MYQTRLQARRQKIDFSTKRFETFLTFNIIQSFLEKQSEGLALKGLQPVTELLNKLVKQYKKWAERTLLENLSFPMSIVLYNNKIFVCETLLHYILVFDIETNNILFLKNNGNMDSMLNSKICSIVVLKSVRSNIIFYIP